MTNIKYSAVTIEMIPKLCVAYKNAYTEIENGDMTELHQQTFLNFVIQNFTNPEFLFLTACSGKKIAGFSIINPLPSIEGVKALSWDCIFVEKEYRQHIEIAKNLFNLTLGWAKNKGYKRIFAYEKIGGHKWDRKKEFGFKPIKTLLSREV